MRYYEIFWAAMLILVAVVTAVTLTLEMYKAGML